MEQNLAQKKPTQVSHSTIHEIQYGYCRLVPHKRPRKKRRISSFDPDVNWENVKGADEEN